MRGDAPDEGDDAVRAPAATEVKFPRVGFQVDERPARRTRFASISIARGERTQRSKGSSRKRSVLSELSSWWGLRPSDKEQAVATLPAEERI